MAPQKLKALAFINLPGRTADEDFEAGASVLFEGRRALSMRACSRE
jgi:hypothetical protein